MDNRAEDISWDGDPDESDILNEPAREGKKSKGPIPKIPAPDRARTPWEMHSQQVQKFDVLTREEEEELARRFQQGDRRVGDEIVMRNQRFVIKMAINFRGYGFDIMDLIQEGNVGLLHAAEKFDPERGTRFVTYAVFLDKSLYADVHYEQHASGHSHVDPGQPPGILELCANESSICRSS